MAAGIRFLVEVEAASPAELIGFAVLATLAFTAIVQALVATVRQPRLAGGAAVPGRPDRRFGAAAGRRRHPGTARVAAPFVPLSYAIDAFHGAIAGSGSNPAVDAVMLAAWLVVALLVTLAAAAGADMREEAQPSAV